MATSASSNPTTWWCCSASPGLRRSSTNSSPALEEKVEDVMRKGEALPLCRESDLIMDQLVELTTKGCGCLIVVDKCKRLIATSTDGDLRQALNSSREGIFHIQFVEMCNRFTSGSEPHSSFSPRQTQKPLLAYCESALSSSLPKCALETDAGRKFDHPEMKTH